MTNSTTIWFGTSSPIKELAAHLAQALDLNTGVEPQGSIYLARIISAKPFRRVFGRFDLNFEPTPQDPRQREAIDGYPIAAYLYTEPRNQSGLREESKKFFEDVSRVVKIPLLFGDDEVGLYAAFTAQGIIEFPDGTTILNKDRAVWEPFDLHRSQLSTDIGNRPDTSRDEEGRAEAVSTDQGTE